MLKYKNQQLHYYGVNLLELAKEFGTPLKVRYLPSIRKNILALKDCFARSMEKWNYPKAYIYANANKANYYADVLLECIVYADAVEVSSCADLKITELSLEQKGLSKKPIVCNGIKSMDYLSEIVSAHNRGLTIIPIFDNLSEYRFFEKSKLLGKMDCGLRINIKNVYKTKAHHVDNDRFGFSALELQEFIKSFNRQKFSLVMLHYHQRADLFDEEKALFNIQYVFEEYYLPLKREFPTLRTFNLGGGVPYAVSGEIDYQKYADNIVKLLVELCQKHNVEPPNIIQENGRYTVADSTAYIYRVINEKNVVDTVWYTVDGSFMSTLPNTWGLGSSFRFMPVNLVDNDLKQVCPAGNTCDSDDVYYHQTQCGRLTMPTIHSDETLYIAVFGAGAYQEMVSGAEGVYHCLLPSAAEVIISKNGNKQNYILRKARQSVDEVLKALRFSVIAALFTAHLQSKNTPSGVFFF